MKSVLNIIQRILVNPVLWAAFFLTGILLLYRTADGGDAVGLTLRALGKGVQLSIVIVKGRMDAEILVASVDGQKTEFDTRFYPHSIDVNYRRLGKEDRTPSLKDLAIGFKVAARIRPVAWQSPYNASTNANPMVVQRALQVDCRLPLTWILAFCLIMLIYCLGRRKGKSKGTDIESR